MKEVYRCLIKKCPDMRYGERETACAILDREPLKSRSALLLVCHESYAIAVKAFSYCFSTEPFLVPEDLNLQPWHRYREPDREVATKGIRFQPEYDTIYLRDSIRRCDDALQGAVLISRIDTSSITFLAVDGSLLEKTDLWECLFVESPGCLSLFTALKEIFILRWKGSDLDALGVYSCWYLWGVEEKLQKFQDLPNAVTFTVKVLNTNKRLFPEGSAGGTCLRNWNGMMETSIDYLWSFIRTWNI